LQKGVSGISLQVQQAIDLGLNFFGLGKDYSDFGQLHVIENVGIKAIVCGLRLARVVSGVLPRSTTVSQLSHACSYRTSQLIFQMSVIAS
jgi:hypothetical protein